MSAGLPILWIDEDAVAIYKPAGWLVHRSDMDPEETRVVLQALRDQLGRHVYPVHRLDKGTCGVLLLALNPVAARALAGAFDARQVVKRYLAFVRGWPEDDAFVDHPLRPDDSPPGAVAQPAQTRVRTLVRVEIPEPSDARFATTRAALIEATPVTGRRHQIRRHLKHIAHPIVGDATHGKGPLNRWWADRLGIQRLWLHAQSIEFNADGARSQEASSGVAWSAIDARLAVDERALEHEPGRQWSELWRALAPFAVDSRREVGPY